MSRAPHQRHAAGARDLIEQHLAGFHISNDRGTRMVTQHVTREHDQKLVAGQNIPLTIDGADAIRVSIEGDAEIRTLLAQRPGSTAPRFFGTVGSG